MQTTYNGIQLIKKSEGFRGTAYTCPGGVLTIGYGNTQDVTPGMQITEADAEKLLKRHLIGIENQLNSLGLKLNQNQFDALIDFIYNVGWGNFRNSTLLKYLRVNINHADIPNEFRKWRLAKGRPLPGLSRRREAEIVLFKL